MIAQEFVKIMVTKEQRARFNELGISAFFVISVIGFTSESPHTSYCVITAAIDVYLPEG